MLREGRRFGKKLLEGGRVFFVFELLGLVAGIEIVLKFPAEIYFLKRVTHSIRRAFVGNLGRASFDVPRGYRLAFKVRPNE